MLSFRLYILYRWWLIPLPHAYLKAPQPTPTTIPERWCNFALTLFCDDQVHMLEILCQSKEVRTSLVKDWELAKKDGAVLSFYQYCILPASSELWVIITSIYTWKQKWVNIFSNLFYSFCMNAFFILLRLIIVEWINLRKIVSCVEPLSVSIAHAQNGIYQ